MRLNIVEILLFIALLLGTPRRGTDTAWKGGVGIAGLVLLLKTSAGRPGLSRRTDAVLSGNFGGGSLWHYAYIGAEGVLTVTLAVLLVMAVRRRVTISAR